MTKRSFINYWDKIKNKIKIENPALFNTLISIICFDQLAILLFNIWDIYESNYSLDYW